MSGCFGSSAEDRYREAELNAYLDSLDAPASSEWIEDQKRAIEAAIENVGALLEELNEAIDHEDIPNHVEALDAINEQIKEL